MAVFLVFALALQPSWATCETASWYEDSLIFVTVGAATAVSYFAGAKLQKGISRVLPALLSSGVFLGLSAYALLSRKLNLHWLSAALPALALFSVLLYKSLKTCPVTGHQGCCCGLNS